MPKRILIVDDSGTVRNVLRSFLETASEIEVCGEASDGLEALEEAQKCKPDLVVLDLSLPKMNGAEVASVLKKRMPLVKIILFTMYSQNIGTSLTNALGVDAVLSKPDGMLQLVACIKSLLK
jgi:DNA-binding NarL/FixJ family response regulator